MSQPHQAGPTFSSLAIDALGAGAIDFADVILLEIGPDLASRWTQDPALAAREIFSLNGLRWPIKVLFGARQLFVTALGMTHRGDEARSFDVREVHDGEALIVTAAPHLDFFVGVAVQDRLLRVTTAVHLKGLKGRLYFAPVAWAHPVVTRSMMRSAVAGQERRSG